MTMKVINNENLYAVVVCYVITKVFKNTKIKVTYSTNNTLRKLLMGEHHPQRNKYENSGI